jgi:hypothetical protein
MIDPTKNETSAEQFLAARKEAGLKIDPETATVMWTYALTRDPYGIFEVPDDYSVGRECFVRSPNSDIWVWFDDLPEATRETLWQMHKSRLAFPAGLERDTKETE